MVWIVEGTAHDLEGDTQGGSASSKAERVKSSKSTGST